MTPEEGPEGPAPTQSRQLQELCALYVLGALDAMEAAGLEARLRAGDAEVAREVAALREVVEHLPYALQPVAPDPAVRARLMRRIQESVPTVGRPARRRGRPRLWLWLPRVAAAILILSLSWMVYDARRQVSGLEAEIQRLHSTAAERQQLLLLLASPQVTIVSLTGSEHAPQAGARVLWDTQHREWTVVTRNLPPLPPGKAYQLWFLTPGAPQPSRTFHPQNGYGIVQVPLPPEQIRVAGAAVSVEPEQGVTQPTGDIVLVGTFGREGQ
jgi:anti-sigma-K factor RskA